MLGTYANIPRGTAPELGPSLNWKEPPGPSFLPPRPSGTVSDFPGVLGSWGRKGLAAFSLASLPDSPPDPSLPVHSLRQVSQGQSQPTLCLKSLGSVQAGSGGQIKMSLSHSVLSNLFTPCLPTALRSPSLGSCPGWLSWSLYT